MKAVNTKHTHTNNSAEHATHTHDTEVVYKYIQLYVV